jgi:predicted Rossmann-fold nucleotide-binding protein
MTSISTPTDLPDYLNARGILKIIAFSGGAATSAGAPGSEAQHAMEGAMSLLEETIIHDALEYLQGYRSHVAILTGGTSFGVPARASRLAKELGFHTIGIFPGSATSKALPEDVLDIRIAVNSLECVMDASPEDAAKFGCQWGDESALFAKTLDAVIVLGGRAGTMVEIAHILKINEGRRKNNQTPKMIVPITATGGMADAAPYLPANPEVRKWCMPDVTITAGTAAAMLLEDRLSLHDLAVLQSPNLTEEIINHEYA